MATPYGDAVSVDNPTVWWRFAESNGTTANDSGVTGNYDGTHIGATVGATALTDDDSDAAVSYDGTDDYTWRDESLDNVTGVDADNYPFSLECIIQTSSAAEMVAVTIYQKATHLRAREIGINGGVAFSRLSNTSAALSGGSNLNDGEKHHLAAVWVNETERYLYVDGVLVDGSDDESSVSVTEAVPNRFQFAVGARLYNLNSSGTRNYFAGTIDEAACYLQKALSAERVAAHAAAMTADAPEPPTATGLPSRKFIVRPCVRPVMYPCVRPCVGG